ncbi:hypothetical protein VTI74DRAFT_6834 [Chaetomium olivicolor]
MRVHLESDGCFKPWANFGSWLSQRPCGNLQGSYSRRFFSGNRFKYNAHSRDNVWTCLYPPLGRGSDGVWTRGSNSIVCGAVDKIAEYALTNQSGPGTGEADMWRWVKWCRKKKKGLCRLRRRVKSLVIPDENSCWLQGTEKSSSDCIPQASGRFGKCRRRTLVASWLPFPAP